MTNNIPRKTFVTDDKQMFTIYHTMFSYRKMRIKQKGINQPLREETFQMTSSNM